MKYLCYIFLFLTLFQSCTDQYSYKTTSLLQNLTANSATLYFFNDGMVYNPNTLMLAESAYIEVFIDQNDGTGKGETYLSSISGFLFDSLIIEFDTGKKSVHYNAGTTGQNPDGLSYNDARNFFNEANWEWVTTSKRRKRYEYEFSYEITEQDYLSAK